VRAPVAGLVPELTGVDPLLTVGALLGEEIDAVLALGQGTIDALPVAGAVTHLSDEVLDAVVAPLGTRLVLSPVTPGGGSSDGTGVRGTVDFR
jgi:hypothetical protein